MSSNSTLSLHLKKAGYSLTKPRQEVFETLASHAPLTMQALWKKLETSADRSSVYRTVALFEKLGIVQRVSRGWKYTLELSDEFVPHHHHLTCSGCGTIISFDEPEGLEDILSSIAGSKGFALSAHTLEVEGLCATCRALN